jgi:hypothetical protein
VKLRIVKKPEYSAGKWRLVYEDGQDVYHSAAIQVDGKEVRYDAPFCADSKERLIEMVLEAMVAFSVQLRQARADALKQPIVLEG